MYEAKNFERLLGAEGFSDVLQRNHFVLYEGYVSNANKLSELLKSTETGTPAYNEIKRRFGWEWNGMRLHELYFGNMTKGGSMVDKKTALIKKIEEDFGSFENWEKDFRATSAIRGVGWAILARDTESGRLFNVWANEHDGGHLAGTTIILVMDVFEHAFTLDYGIKRADYISAFWKAIDWSVVNDRFAGK
ncbi:MAG: superoxide dismutase [Candidatus Yonathbacteria bacterium RIFCSPHIGHO2_01_FULL_44_41]|uniref:superoxide dismutase n=1 Tax=Candidatus Yonathbacteria bacterium RIFCSPHIGHO2_02_FULL_44_14 TaxID=1802724 RepID=A0A1G2S9H6_9BACT|nr:MAG: superoxide dismutase [Candidatus Yonathbacteria bacterium RIFCSPHIGHO2_01_FULL_44_41]OHA80862.1 MAG: superoxide dismutase [Candidatus Yonathbacteria bacterium RIFCSPLOWO2_01_FULL_43_20]OHA81359.1 MAG: superoxide dismutase [Candidatus Yonathbacteria bacterium RIFCSPHIGHO2_02_FULL_44_14]